MNIEKKKNFYANKTVYSISQKFGKRSIFEAENNPLFFLFLFLILDTSSDNKTHILEKKKKLKHDFHILRVSIFDFQTATLYIYSRKFLVK